MIELDGIIWIIWRKRILMVRFLEVISLSMVDILIGLDEFVRVGDNFNLI